MLTKAPLVAQFHAEGSKRLVSLLRVFHWCEFGRVA